MEEIERAGSFGTHLYKAIYLLLQYLHEKRDYNILYQLYLQLNRNPDQEKLVNYIGTSSSYSPLRNVVTTVTSVLQEVPEGW